MSVAVAVQHQQGAFRLDARFDSEARLTALFGRSGAGKTTLVQLIAGLVRPSHGRIEVDGRVLVDTATRLNVPAYRRHIGYIFQEGRLFPHLTVRQNLLYGRWLTKPAQRFGTIADIVELLGIGTLLARRPAALSGGEKQRVAIGRAVLASPRLLLMDEPLASLDAGRKAEILPFIERLRDELRIPIVYVTHSIEEVVRLAGDVVLLAEGRVLACGPPPEVLTRLDLGAAVGRFEAGAVLTAIVRDPVGSHGLARLDHPAGELLLARHDLPPGRTVRLRVRARDVALARGEVGALSIRNRLRATVLEVGDGPGPVVDVRLDVGGEPLLARITRHAVLELGIAPGVAVTALIKSVSFDRAGRPRSDDPPSPDDRAPA